MEAQGQARWNLGDVSSACILPLIHGDQLSGEALCYTETCSPWGEWTQDSNPLKLKGCCNQVGDPPRTLPKASVMSGFIDSSHKTVPAKISKHPMSITFLISLRMDHEEEQKEQR